MRNLGHGTITISGVPAGATVQSATLIWDVVADQDLYAYRQGSFDGVPVTGVAWDIGDTPCWPPAQNNSFEADVTALVTGNGSYQLSGFASGETDGADPWLAGSEPPLFEGATLVVIYQLASLPRTAIQIDMGAFMSTAGNPASATITGFQAAADHAATTTYIVADGQEAGNTATFDENSLDQVGFPGADPQAVPGYSMGNLWDTVTADVSSLIQPGDTDATASVTGFNDCIVWVGQVLAVQLPAQVQVGAVRFAAADATGPATQGLPVIKDDVLPPVTDHQSGPASCHGLASPRSYDYLDCMAPSTNDPAKQWPVIYAANSPLTIGKAVFFASSLPADPVLTATAMIGGSVLKLPPTTLTAAPVSGGYQLTASDLIFTGKLPSTPSLSQLDISWTVTDGGVAVDAGTSTHPVFVTAAPYAEPENADALPPYVTLLDVGTEAASGQTSPKSVFRAIWQKFATRDIAHPILDPVTGMITSGPDIAYYENGYRTIGDWFRKFRTACPPDATALAKNSGHCGNWAEYLANILAYQGISASVVNLDDGEDFYLGPDPARHDPARDYAYMLIEPSLWSFTAKNAAGSYDYSDPISIGAGTMSVTGSHVQYEPTDIPIAQGLVTTPPELFYTGDHAIVHTPWGYVDPSYGTPQGNVPYQSIAAYEKDSIAGFAVIYHKTRDGSYVPIPARESKPADVIFNCAPRKCEFRAVPYDQSGAP